MTGISAQPHGTFPEPVASFVTRAGNMIHCDGYMGDADDCDSGVCGLCEDECACAHVRGVLCEVVGVSQGSVVERWILWFYREEI